MTRLSAQQLADISEDLRPMRDYLLRLQARSIEVDSMAFAAEVQKAADPVCELVNVLEQGARQAKTAAILNKLRSAEPAGDPNCGADRRTGLGE